MGPLVPEDVGGHIGGQSRSPDLSLPTSLSFSLSGEVGLRRVSGGGTVGMPCPPDARGVRGTFAERTQEGTRRGFATRP